MTNKARKRKLDKIWADKIKSLGYCEWCGKQGALNAHHVFGRRYMNLRYELSNGVALCVGCHFKAHEQPLVFAEYIISENGDEWYKTLKDIRNTIKKVDLDAAEKYLRGRMNPNEYKVFKALNKSQQMVGYVLYYHPHTRDMNTDDFIEAFRRIYPTEKIGMETIRRSRQMVQNTKRFCPRRGKPGTWEKPVREAGKTGLDLNCQGSFL